LQGGRLFCLSARDSGRALFQTKPDILIRQGGRVVHVIDTKWKRISARIDDAKQSVSQADVYQMMAYAQLYGALRLTLLYPHHSGLGINEKVHAQYSINRHNSVIEHTAELAIASIDISKSANLLARLACLLNIDKPVQDG